MRGYVNNNDDESSLKHNQSECGREKCGDAHTIISIGEIPV